MPTHEITIRRDYDDFGYAERTDGSCTCGFRGSDMQRVFTPFEQGGADARIVGQHSEYKKSQDSNQAINQKGT